MSWEILTTDRIGEILTLLREPVSIVLMRIRHNQLSLSRARAGFSASQTTWATLCAGVLFACGSAEPLDPLEDDGTGGVVMSNAGGSRTEGEDQTQSPLQPDDSGGQDMPVNGAADAGAGNEPLDTDDAGERGGGDPGDEDPVQADTQAFRACYGEDIGGCGKLLVAATLPEDSLCVRLNIDNCGSYSSTGLSADLPFGWRLSSASARSGIESCVLGEFDSGSASALDARGLVEWPADEDPADVVLDLVLEFSSRPEVPRELELTGPAAGISVDACE